MKASALTKLVELGFPVPSFQVIWSDNIPSPDTILTDESGLFAVRSSYAEEDSDERSFAGAFTTLLNVKREDLPEAIDEVFKSYRKIQERSSEPSRRQCVIVQKMITAELSGIMFTSNPLGLLNEISITVGDGKGDKIVEDQVETDLFSYNKDTKDLRAERTGHSVITDEQLDLLADTALKVEEGFGKAMDIEFCFTAEGLYILQSRPITTIPDLPLTILDNSNLVENYPGIVSPLTADFAKQVYARMIKSLLRRAGGKTAEKLIQNDGEQLVCCVSGRMYYRLDKWYRLFSVLPFSQKILSVWQEALGLPPEENSQHVAWPLGTRLKIAKNFVKLMLTNKKDMASLDEWFFDNMVKWRRRIENTRNIRALDDVYNKMMDDVFSRWGITLATDLYAFLFTTAAGGKDQLGTGDEMTSTRSVRAFTTLVKTAKEEGFESEKYRRLTSSYISLYGDRVVGELKLETKTLRTNPELLQKMIESALQEDDDETIEQKTDITSSSTKPSGFFAKKAIRMLSDRETSRLNRTVLFGMMRQLFLKCGDILYEQQRIEAPEDVFFLETDEIFFRQGDIAQIVARRKEMYEAYPEGPLPGRLVFAGKPFDLFGERVIPAHLDYDDSYNDDYDDVYNIMEENHISLFSGQKTLVLRGYGTSRGKVRGEAVIVKDISNPPNVKNKIIIAESTDPGWVFLIRQSKGVIAERGSLLSHTAIITRELGKPAVVGIKDASSYIADGDTIELDGLAGVVSVLHRQKRKHENK